MAGGIRLEELVLLESTECSDVYCVPGYRHLSLFGRDCMKIIKEGKGSEKVDGAVIFLLAERRAVLIFVRQQEWVHCFFSSSMFDLFQPSFAKYVGKDG